MTPRQPLKVRRAVVSVAEAAAVLEMGESTFYAAIRKGHPPVPVVETTGIGCVQKAWRVPTAGLLAALGLPRDVDIDTLLPTRKAS